MVSPIGHEWDVVSSGPHVSADHCMTASIACPKCGHHSDETIPEDRCLFFFECPNCHAVLKPKPGDCCVFCSYGDTKCPSAACTPREADDSLEFA